MKKLLPLMFLLMSLASAQTATTYQSSSGTVSPGNAVTGHLDLGGSFVSADGMGSGCYYGGCPDWTFSGYTLSYVLPKGTTANFTNQKDVTVQGTASGHDSTGAFVTVSEVGLGSLLPLGSCWRLYEKVYRR